MSRRTRMTTEALAAMLDPLQAAKVLEDTPPRGRGRRPRHNPGEMNKTEAEYARNLEDRADVLWWAFEAITLKLGHDCRYTPDFLVLRDDFTLELHECKGFMEDDALVKIKVAARHFPFSVFLVRRDGRGWAVNEVKP